ncbi:hypothetical protein [Ensifer sp. 1H6]|uniref:hypothetical protein n=1 Tax=Ensifer sp. 1H6 TaxID=1911585 RepID=UPI001FD8C12E|nr:hypothetical protein [Ensifer sp. 1H6]
MVAAISISISITTAAAATGIAMAFLGQGCARRTDHPAYRGGYDQTQRQGATSDCFRENHKKLLFE